MSTPTRRRATEKAEEAEPRRARAVRPEATTGQELEGPVELGHVPPLLRDPGYSPPPNLPREASGILRLQRALGNGYVQRLVEGPGREKHQPGERALLDETAEGIEAAHGAGQPLEPQLRSEMEAALGHDFGGVRVHTGREAHALAESLGARAFTTDHDIFFRNGAYEPGSPAGRETLGHELAHVVQQAESNGALTPGLSLPSDTAEMAAGIVGAEVAGANGARSLPPAVSEVAAIQRQIPGEAPPGGTAVSTPAPAAPAAGSRAAVALAMWRSAVVGPQTRAAEILATPNKANAATALELVGSAREAANALANTLPGDSFPRARVMQYSNALYGVIADLRPHAGGEVVSIEEIRGSLGGTAASQAAVEAALQQEEIVVPASGGV